MGRICCGYQGEPLLTLSHEPYTMIRPPQEQALTVTGVCGGFTGATRRSHLFIHTRHSVIFPYGYKQTVSCSPCAQQLRASLTHGTHDSRPETLSPNPCYSTYAPTLDTNTVQQNPTARQCLPARPSEGL